MKKKDEKLTGNPDNLKYQFDETNFKHVDCEKCKAVKGIAVSIKQTPEGVETIIYKCRYCGHQYGSIDSLLNNSAPKTNSND